MVAPRERTDAPLARGAIKAPRASLSLKAAPSKVPGKGTGTGILLGVAGVSISGARAAAQ